MYELLSFDEGEEADPAVRVYASGGVMWTYYDRGDGESFGVEELIAEALEYKGPALPADPNTHIGSVTDDASLVRAAREGDESEGRHGRAAVTNIVLNAVPRRRSDPPPEAGA